MERRIWGERLRRKSRKKEVVTKCIIGFALTIRCKMTTKNRRLEELQEEPADVVTQGLSKRSRRGMEKY